MTIEESSFYNCKKKVNFAGKYKGNQNITSSIGGITITTSSVSVIITITKVKGGIDAYNLHYKFDAESNIPDINGLGNVIDNKLIHIAPSSTYNYFQKMKNNKLFHKFVGLNNAGVSLSGTEILYKQKV